jgi:ABC-type sugar transport system ATPase subunit
MADFVQFRSVTKTFGGVTALSDVSLGMARGECHGLMGENGAGKSTLGKVLAGIHRPDSGDLVIDGSAHVFGSPRDALAAGVAMVHQELAFCPELSIAENLALGHYPRRAGGILLDHHAMRRRAEELLGGIGVRLDVSRPMRELSTAQEQLVQIAAAVGANPRILVFDEPTSSLSATDAESLFDLIGRLRARGLTLIYVSHRMPELFRLCDRISVLRDGRYVGTLGREEMTHDAVVRMMIGRSVDEYFPQHPDAAPGRAVLEVRELSSPGKFRDLTLTVHSGEIVGFAGLVGSGRSEFARALFGLDPRATGSVVMDGHPLRPGSVKRSLAAGIGLVPEDRKRQGCVPGMSCRANISMAVLDRLRRLGLLLDHSREQAVSSDYFARLHIRAASPEAPVHSLSGGNQQKVVIAKWLARGGRLLIVDEPTRGVDVGAKAAIHRLLDDLARQGLAIILISSELPEILNLSTRILVMREGRLAGELPRNDATQDAVLRLMTGVPPWREQDAGISSRARLKLRSVAG